MNLAGKRVTLLGLGRHGGGVGAARHLARQGAVLTITDLASREALADSIAALDGLPIAHWSLGEHVEHDFRTADVVVINPAIKPDNPCVRLARAAGAKLTSEIELFLRACPARVAGVTGSSGKSSTAAMLANIAKAAGYRTWLGGNLGGSLLDDVDEMQPDDRVVLELSSFQLYWLSNDAPRPKIAIITNLTPNHLDWHPDFEHYAQSKRKILGGVGQRVVLDDRSPGLAGWKGEGLGEAAQLVPELAIVGHHQRSNAALAAKAALLWGCNEPAIRRGLAEFRGLSHRLQFVAEVQGRRFYDDSKATTPESAIAALEAFDGPVWLLAGGSDKGADLAGLAQRIVAQAQGVFCYGATGPRLHELVRRLAPTFDSHLVGTLDEAVARAWAASRPGDTILLSPACASFDQFRDYEDRGRRFVACVEALNPAPASG